MPTNPEPAAQPAAQHLADGVLAGAGVYGRGLTCLAATVVFPTKADGRRFTPTEQRVIHRMLSMAREAYEFASELNL